MRLPVPAKTAVLIVILALLMGCFLTACSADTATAPTCRIVPARVDLDTMPPGSFIVEIRITTRDTTCKEKG